MRKTELLIPASNLEVLKVAVLYGADAVYIGGEMYGLRAKAKNFSMDDVREGICFAHEHGVRVYITANIVAHNGDLSGIREYFRELRNIKPDGLIISDPGVFMIAKEECPEIERHISTQANSTNYATYKFWQEQGASRVVAARELSLREIKEIREHIPVYIGGEMYGLRAKAKNFSMDDVREGICFAHEHGVRVYITANIVAHNGDLSGIREYFRELRNIKPDGLIISDPGVFMIAKEECPEIERHISTQANSTNYATYKFWQEQGASRVVAARELSLREIKEIREHIPDDLEIEAFVHGAMCISHSGRCLLSNYFTGQNANKGACTHPCRWKYSVVEETRPGEYMPVYENERGTYIFNSKDLCMIEHIDDLIGAGIDSLKIEGRMKTALYVAAVARTYRKAIDDYRESPEKYFANMDYYRQEISKCTYRQFTTGFYYGKTDEHAQIYDSNTYVKEYTYIGIVQGHNEKGFALLEQKNKFLTGETIEVMIPGGENLQVTVKAIEDEDGVSMESAPHPRQMIYVDFGEEIPEGYLLRRKEE